MLWTFIVVLLAGASRAEDYETYSVQCSIADAKDPSLAVTAATDGTAGRYIVEYCTAVEPGVSRWLLLMYTVSKPQQNCTYEILQESVSGSSHSHSEEFLDLAEQNITCPRVCFSKPMDLMFRGCYRLQNTLFYDSTSGSISRNLLNGYFFADNNVTAASYINDSLQFFTDIDYESTISFHWFEGRIPITQFEITVWPNDTHSEEVLDVTSNCTKQLKALRCELALAAGCYTLQLKHLAPWTKGYHARSVHEGVFCHSGTVPPAARRAESPWPWALGAAALLAAAGGAALLAARLRWLQQTRLGRRAKRLWIELSASRDAEKAEAEAGAAGARVVLVAAREGPAGARLAGAARALLMAAAPAQVYDLYSPEVVSLAAPNPSAWLREVFFSPEVKVVVIQTPALAALHSVKLAEGDILKLEEPLLPRRAVYRSPVFGDTLLKYALQLLQEVSHTQPDPPYKKYFLATLSGLPVDMFPAIVPYTRYELPAASLALLHTLRPGASASETDVAELTAAAAAFVQYATENPHYLAEHLVFL